MTVSLTHPHDLYTIEKTYWNMLISLSPPSLFYRINKIHTYINNCFDKLLEALKEYWPVKDTIIFSGDHDNMLCKFFIFQYKTSPFRIKISLPSSKEKISTYVILSICPSFNLKSSELTRPQ